GTPSGTAARDRTRRRALDVRAAAEADGSPVARRLSGGRFHRGGDGAVHRADPSEDRRGTATAMRRARAAFLAAAVLVGAALSASAAERQRGDTLTDTPDQHTQIEEVMHALVRLPIAAGLATVLAVRPRRRGTPHRRAPVIQTFEPKATQLFGLTVKAKDPAKIKIGIDRLLSRYRLEHALRSTSKEEVSYDVHLPFDRQTDRLSEQIAQLDPEAAVQWEEK